MRNWQTVPIPLISGGEDTASAPTVGQRPSRVENALITGTNVAQQMPDWTVAATMVNGSATESDAVCGIFPFATQGGATNPSAGVVFSFNTTANSVYLHQMDEDHAIDRLFVVGGSYTESAPPQVTGFEMFGKFYFCEDGRQAAASRVGMGVFDPASGGTVTIPTFDLVSGGASAAALRFVGITKHRGGTILGWGYGDEEAGNIDAPHMIRYCEYVTPDTWVPATDQRPTTAGRFVVGTLNLPIVACAVSGQYTVIGKKTEVYVLDGDYSAQFYVRQVGTSHGPLSTTGMVSIGGAAVWMSAEGPAVSVNGGAVELLAIDRATRRLLTYFDLTYAWAVHDSRRTRVGWLLRRATSIDGMGLTAAWGDEVFWWDYERNIFYVTQTPNPCFSIGVTDGPGVALAGPGAAPNTTSEVADSTWADLTWVNGDASAVTFIEYKKTADSTYTVVGPAATGVTTWQISGLTASTAYDWRVRHFKNGQYSSYATDSFTTTAAGTVTDPTNFVVESASSQVIKAQTFWTANFTWDRGEFSPGSRTQVWESLVTPYVKITSTQVLDADSSVTGYSTEKLESSTDYYYWVRHSLADGTEGNLLSLSGDPIQYNSSLGA